jgi:hypothetical protein
MANEQQDQNPHGEDRESSQQAVPSKSADQTIRGPGHQSSSGQDEQNEDRREQAKPGVQQRNPGSSGTKHDEQDAWSWPRQRTTQTGS